MSKLRKVHVNDVEYGWSVANQMGDGSSELRIWNTETKQIIHRKQLGGDNEFPQITPSYVMEEIQSFLKT